MSARTKEKTKDKTKNDEQTVSIEASAADRTDREKSSSPETEENAKETLTKKDSSSKKSVDALAAMIEQKVQMSGSAGLGEFFGRMRPEITDAFFAALEREADVSKVVPSSLSKLDDGQVVDLLSVGEERALSQSLFQLEVVTSIPHFYQLTAKQIGALGAQGGYLKAYHGEQVYPFIDPVANQFGRGFDLAYVRINTSGQGVELFIDPFDFDKVSCKVGGESLTGIGLSNAVGVDEITYDDVKTPEQMMEFVVLLIAGAAKMGRFVLVASTPEGGGNLFKTWVRRPVTDNFRHVQGWLLEDDYENYPHVPEALTVFSEYQWFAREVSDNMTDNGLGTSVQMEDGPNIESFFNRKYREAAICNLDFITAEAHANVMEELQNEKMNVSAYVDLLQSCQMGIFDIEGDTDIIKLKVYMREVEDYEAELTRMMLFPGDQLYVDCLRTAALVSPNIRQFILSVLVQQATSRVGLIELLPVAEMTASLTSRDNISVSHNMALTLAIGEWKELLRLTNPQQICQKIVCDIMAPFVDGLRMEDSLGVPTPSKLVFSLLGAKVALILTPNLYDYNLHLKAHLVTMILSCFFPDQYGALIASRGYGHDVTGNRIDSIRDGERTKKNCRFATYTVLDPIPNGPPDRTRRKWLLMKRVQEWLLRNDLVRRREIRDIIYRPYANVLRLPGQTYLPRRQAAGAPLPCEVLLNDAIAILEEYRTVFHHPNDRNQGPQDRHALTTLSNLLRWYTRGFAEWFHWVYCPLYLQIALHPIIFWSHRLGQGVWRQFPAVREDRERRFDNHLEGVPFDSPVIAAFEPDVALNPFTLRQGADLLGRVHAQGSTFRGGAYDSASVILLSEYEALYRMTDSEGMVDEYIKTLMASRQLLEGLRLVAELSTGELLRDTPILDYIRTAFCEGRFPSHIFFKILNLFGVRINHGVLAQVGERSIEHRLRGDYRVYYPRPGFLDPALEFIPDRIVVVDPVRPSVRRNVKLIMDAVFDPEFGMIKMRKGVTFSLRPTNDLTFSSFHEIPPIQVEMTGNVNYVYDSETARTRAEYDVQVRWEAPERIVTMNLLVTSSYEILSSMEDILGREVRAFSFVVQDVSKFSGIYYDFMLSAVRKEHAIVWFPNLRGILHHHAISIEKVETCFQAAELAQFSSFLSLRPTALIKLNVVQTTNIRGGILPPSVSKPILPCEGVHPSFIFCSDVNVATHRIRGTTIQIRKFFPPLVKDASGRPRVTDENGVVVNGLENHPYGLRSLVFVYHFDPTFRPKICSVLR
nr:VP2 [Salmon River virus]